MRTWVAIVATALATAAAMRLTGASAATNVVTAKSFQLEDEEGNARGYFGFNTNGDAQLSVCDVGGPCATLTRDSLQLRDDAGVLRAQVYLASDGKARVDLCDENRRACVSIIENLIVLYDSSTGAQVETVDITPRGMFLAYPGAGSFRDREAATFTTDTYSGSEFVALTVGARGDGTRVRFSPPQGVQLATGRPTVTTPSPYADVSVTGSGVDRVLLSNAKWGLVVTNSHGKRTLRK